MCLPNPPLFSSKINSSSTGTLLFQPVEKNVNAPKVYIHGKKRVS
jgi:hypothetical protein